MRNLLAALMFFTRLPWWRVATVSKESFSRVVDYWSLIGWLTGSVTALVLWLGGRVWPMALAVTVALVSRLLLTGALHEDGLADFVDGMGGGGNRERILSIMKDSHIGTYGVIALIMYMLLMVTAVSTLPLAGACATVFAADTWSKFCASQLINLLPYARSESKNGVVYSRMSAGVFVLSLVAGALPLLLMPALCVLAAVMPLLVTMALVALLRHKIGGYTGDCCGAAYLLGELSFVLTVCALWSL